MSARSTHRESSIDDRGKWQIEINVPLLAGRRHVGAMVGVVSGDAMLRCLVPARFADTHHLWLVIGEDKVMAASSATRPVDDSLVHVTRIEPIGHDVKLCRAAIAPPRNYRAACRRR